MQKTIKPLKRNLFPINFKIDTFENLNIYLIKILDFKISNKIDFELFLNYISEAEAIISEDACWRQIKTTCDTENKEYQENFNYFFTEIQPKLQEFSDKINKKIINSEFAKELPKDYSIYIRNIRKNIELFNEKNINIFSELAVLQQNYGNITGAMTVNINNKELTLNQASLFLKDYDYEVRKDAYFKIQERRFTNKDELNELFTTLINKRNEIALNCNFSTYTKYKFKELGRFEYNEADCFNFHNGIKNHILPIVNLLYKNKKNKLQLTTLKPWDLDATAKNEKILKPFQNTNELLDKSINCLKKVDKYFGDCLIEMKSKNNLDLESRKGKAPGGYNCPLLETGMPFIFMNAAGTLDDVITLLHESGHAVHSFLSHNLELSGFKEYPMEIAELASMSMELFTLNEWNIFFENPEDFKRAKLQQWERVITIFPWIAIIDKFQHWIYNNPNHNLEERSKEWQKIFIEFSSSEIDYSESQKYLPYNWQKQLHLFEVPFYYIEYGIAQLGAISMYKNYKENKELCIQNYKKALSLGGKYSLTELYEIAGIKLKFDDNYIKEIFEFVNKEMQELLN